MLIASVFGPNSRPDGSVELALPPRTSTLARGGLGATAVWVMVGRAAGRTSLVQTCGTGGGGGGGGGGDALPVCTPTPRAARRRYEPRSEPVRAGWSQMIVVRVCLACDHVRSVDIVARTRLASRDHDDAVVSRGSYKGPGLA